MPTKKHAKKRRRKAPEPRRLTDQQAMFCREYIVDFNGTQAAIRSGYARSGAQVQASRLLSKAMVQAEIATLMKARNERVQVDADWTLRRLVAEAQADIADLFNDAGNLKPVHEWPLIWRQGLISGIEAETHVEKGDTGTGQWHGQAQDVHEEEGRVETTVTKLKLSDRIKRIELIGRHVDVQAFKDRKELSADEPLRRIAEQIGGQSIRPQPDAGDGRS